MIISPDEGALTRDMYYSSVLGVKLGMFYKRRDYTVVKDGRNPIVAHEYLGEDVRGRDLIIVDDIVSSGESFLHVLDKLKSRGAGRIFGFFTFGLFCNGYDAFEDCYQSGMFSRVYTTNSVYIPDALRAKEWYREVDVLKYIAYYIEAGEHQSFRRRNYRSDSQDPPPFGEIMHGTYGDGQSLADDECGGGSNAVSGRATG